MIQEAEVEAFVYEFLAQINPDIAAKYRDEAGSGSAGDGVEQTLGALPPNYFSTLVESRMPRVDFPSLITRSDKFDVFKRENRLDLVCEHVKRLHLTNRIVGHTGDVRIIFVDPARLFFISVSDDSTMKLWHLPSLSLMFTFKGHEKVIWDVDVAPDREVLVSVSDDRTLRLWSLLDGRCLCMIKRAGLPPLTCVRFSSCGKYLVSCAERSEKVVIWEVRDEEMRYQNPVQLKTVSLKSPVKYCCFSPGASLVAAVLESGFVAVFTVLGNYLWTSNIGEKCDYCCFNPNVPSQLIASSTKGGVAVMLNISSKLGLVHEFNQLVKRAGQSAFAVSCDYSLLFGCNNAHMIVWDLGDGSVVQKIDGLLPGSLVGHPVVDTLVAHVSKSCVSIYSCLAHDPVAVYRIPPNAPGIVSGYWDRNGLAFYAGDRLGGIYVFRQSESVPVPRCVTTEHFFPTDFTPSHWDDSQMQLEDSNLVPVHLNPRTQLVNSNVRMITPNYRPHNFCDIHCPIVWNKATRYMRDIEKKMIMDYGSITEETVEPDGEDKSEDFEEPGPSLIDEVEVAFSDESTSSSSEQNAPAADKRRLWITLDKPGYGVYFPQAGDEVVYLKTGHAQMIEARADLSPDEPFESDFWPAIGNFKIDNVEFFWDYCEITMSGPTGTRTFKYDIDNAPYFLIPAAIYQEALSVFQIAERGFEISVYYRSGDMFILYNGRIKKKEETETLFNSVLVEWDEDAGEDLISPWEIHSIGGEDVYDYIPKSPELAKVQDALMAVLNAAFKARCMRPLFKQPRFCEALVYPCDLGLIKRRITNGFYRHKEALLCDLNAVAHTQEVIESEEQDLARAVVERLCRVVHNPEAYESEMDFSNIDEELEQSEEVPEPKEMTRVKKGRNTLKATQSVYEYDLEDEIDTSDGSASDNYEGKGEDDEDDFRPVAVKRSRKKTEADARFIVQDKRASDDYDFNDESDGQDDYEETSNGNEETSDDNLDEFTVENGPRVRKRTTNTNSDFAESDLSEES